MQLGENAWGNACRFSHARQVQFQGVYSFPEGGHGGSEEPLLPPLRLALTPPRCTLPPQGVSSAHQAASWLAGRKETQPAARQFLCTDEHSGGPQGAPHPAPRPCHAASCVSARRHDAKGSQDGWSRRLWPLRRPAISLDGRLGWRHSAGLWRRRGLQGVARRRPCDPAPSSLCLGSPGPLTQGRHASGPRGCGA